jgi:hypothetical protein
MITGVHALILNPEAELTAKGVTFTKPRHAMASASAI